MDRTDAALVLVALLGVAVILAAPPDPQYSIAVAESAAPPDADVTAFDSLDEEAQTRFRQELAGDTGSFGAAPALANGYVDYEGTTYRVDVSAHEGPVLAVLLPLVGMGLLAVAGVGLAGRRGWRAIRGRRDAAP